MSNFEDVFHDDEDDDIEVPEAFASFVEEGDDLWPSYSNDWEDVDALLHLPGKVFDVITEVLMDVKVGLDTFRYPMVHRMPLPSRQQSYIIREQELFDMMRHMAARVYMIATQPDDDDGLPF